MVDEAAFNPTERLALSAVEPDERPLARARLWARKEALLRALGHSELGEPSRLALSAPWLDGGEGRVIRAVPELGSTWRQVRLHDVETGDDVAAAVAVLG